MCNVTLNFCFEKVGDLFSMCHERDNEFPLGSDERSSFRRLLQSAVFTETVGPATAGKRNPQVDSITRSCAWSSGLRHPSNCRH